MTRPSALHVAAERIGEGQERQKRNQHRGQLAEGLTSMIVDRVIGFLGLLPIESQL